MMLGELSRPSIQVPPWPSSPPPDTTSHSPYSPLFPLSGIDSPPSASYATAYAALSRFLPSSNPDLSDDSDDASAVSAAVDAYSCDEFRMYEFKVRRCARGRSHDWTECPYAHPGEKARRRDPRRYHYSGAACPDFRKGSCKRGDACEFAHGVFECWLHPARYRTQPCKDGVACRRRVCFFAHTPDQLRVLPGAGGASQHSPRAGGNGSGSFNNTTSTTAAVFDSYDGSPMRQHHLTSLEAYFPSTMPMSSSPTSTLASPPITPPSDSPPLSPSSGPSPIRRGGSSSVNELLASFRHLQLSSSPVAAAVAPWQHMGACSPPVTTVRRGPPPPVSGFPSVPSTPTGSAVGVVLRKPSAGLYDVWGDDSSLSPMTVVESGRDLRAKLAEKLSKENSLGRPVDASAAAAAGPGPDVGWVSDLLN